jgi:cation transport regulator ChaC
VKRGNCYVTCEALYHLLGGKNAGWKAKTLHHEGDVHWYLVNGDLIVDPTAKQFESKPDYSKGVGRGFLTKQPSKRALAMMDTLVWQR